MSQGMPNFNNSLEETSPIRLQATEHLAFQASESFLPNLNPFSQKSQVNKIQALDQMAQLSLSQRLLNQIKNQANFSQSAEYSLLESQNINHQDSETDLNAAQDLIGLRNLNQGLTHDSQSIVGNTIYIQEIARVVLKIFQLLSSQKEIRILQQILLFLINSLQQFLNQYGYQNQMSFSKRLLQLFADKLQNWINRILKNQLITEEKSFGEKRKDKYLKLQQLIIQLEHFDIELAYKMVTKIDQFKLQILSQGTTHQIKFKNAQTIVNFHVETIPLFQKPKHFGVKPIDQRQNQHQQNIPITINTLKNLEEYKGGKKISLGKQLITVKNDQVAKINFTTSLLYKQRPFQYPYSTIGYLKTKINHNSFAYGNGCLMGHNIVITAAHNILPHQCLQNNHKIQQCINFFFSPDQDPYRVSKIFIPNEFKQMSYSYLMDSSNNLYDYAFLELDTQEVLENKYGSIGFDFSWQSNQMHSCYELLPDCKIVGFPFHTAGQKLCQFESEILIDKNYLVSKAPTEKGISGSPVVQLAYHDYFLRAIHQRDISYIAQSAKAALKLNQDMFEKLQQNFTVDRNNFTITFLHIREAQLGMIIEVINQKIRKSPKNQNRLTLRENCLGDKGCQLISSKLQFKRLRILQLQSNQIGAQGCKYLAKVNLLNLQNLNLLQNQIGPEGCSFLAQANLLSLKELYLENNKIGDEGCKFLAQGKWVYLQILHLQVNKIGHIGCQYLSKAPWTHLDTLYLRNNNVDELSCQHLSKSVFINLRNFGLSNNQLGSKGPQYLAKGPWNSVYSLYLRFNNIGPIVCKWLTQPKFKDLTILYLRNNKIGRIGCYYLKYSPFRNLEKIYLKQNSIGDKGCKYLSQAPWSKLQKLHVQTNGITAQGCGYLADGPWNKLWFLSLEQNPIGQQGFDYVSDKKWMVKWDPQYKEETDHISEEQKLMVERQVQESGQKRVQPDIESKSENYPVEYVPSSTK